MFETATLESSSSTVFTSLDPPNMRCFNIFHHTANGEKSWSLESFGALYLLFLFEFCSLKATFRAVQGMWTKELVRHLFPGTQQKHSLTAQLVLKQQTETFKALAPRLHSGTTFPEKLSGTTSTDNRLGCQHSWQVLNPVQPGSTHPYPQLIADPPGPSDEFSRIIITSVSLRTQTLRSTC